VTAVVLREWRWGERRECVGGGAERRSGGRALPLQPPTLKASCAISGVETTSVYFPPNQKEKTPPYFK
jgi:hypothetical protein